MIGSTRMFDRIKKKQKLLRVQFGCGLLIRKWLLPSAVHFVVAVWGFVFVRLDAPTPGWNIPGGNMPDRYTADWNMSDWYTPDWNMLERNTPDWNTPTWNMPDWNTLDCDMPAWSTPDWNTPDWNMPEWNTPEQHCLFR